MKICLINNLYPPYIRGGAERVVKTIADGLARNGHDVFIIATCSIFKKSKISAEGICASPRLVRFRRRSALSGKNQKSKIYCIPALYYNLNKLPIILRLFWHIVDMFDAGSFMRVRTILKKEKPDMVMTHNLKGVGFLVPLAIKLSGIKYIHTLHDIQLIHPSGLMIYGKEKKINGVFAKIYAAICRFLFGSPDVVISPSKWLLKIHEERGFFKKSKKAIMPNPMPAPLPTGQTGLIKRSAEGMGGVERRSEEGIFRFLYVGQIEKHKGIFLLIKVFKIFFSILLNKGGRGGIRGARMGCELVIVGGGSKLEETKKMAGNDENIKFLGRKTSEEVRELMLNSDCLIVPSLCYENSPTVIYEAFSVGLPVIGADLGGIPELLGEMGGILFEPNEDKLAAKIEWAANNKEELKEITEKAEKKIRMIEMGDYINKLINV